MTIPLRSILLFLLLPPAMSHAQQYEWQVIARPSTIFLTAVVFIDTLNGIIAGGAAGYYVTTDGGNTWTPSTGATFRTSALSMADPRNGWSAGNIGLDARINHTTDGGRTWVDQRSIYLDQYNGACAQSALRMTVVGEKSSGPDTGLIIQTTNGGATWQEQRFGANTRLRKVVFVDSLHGWINAYLNQGTSGAILRTRDGGVTWQQSNTPYLFRTMTFIDTLRGWAGFGGTFFRTVDGGITWDSLYRVPIPGDSFGMNDLSFTDTSYGWAFGGAFFQGTSSEAIYHTTNGGVTWYRESIGLTADFGDLFDGIMLDRTHGWAVAGDGRVLAYKLVTSVVERLPDVPTQFTLRQNYPNPFNPTTSIEYELVQRTNVKITVYDINGKEIRQLVNGEQDAGVYRIRFDGSGLASGTYYCRMNAGSFVETKQMVLVK